MDGRHAIALTVAYEGSPFCGFARQPEVETVQGRLEHALEVVLRREVDTIGAGRTDAGVHALGQVVSFEADGCEPPPREFRRSLDALTGDGMVVREVRYARPGFSARFDAVSREYRYRLVAGMAPPLFLRGVSWHVARDLDLEGMRSASAALLGEHDFRSFCVSESAQGKRTVRRLDAIELAEREHLGESCIEIRIVGNAFLHSMVRVIVGTLVEVGTGRHDPDWVSQALAAQTREAAGPTAPAHGLTLWSVAYPEDVWLQSG